ncbi:hypothetical protein [Acidiferrobacter sp.]|uniref:carboxymuconolactone decarboxylase family protein n=1 Tax=Acidiferrobacter sp. TaxID=1872107 RepID=UPI00260B5EA8|nr:hypothetical protein [Acidiferrobacter sp.]
MTLLTTQSPEAATGAVAKTYEAITHLFGRVPNALRIYSSSPELLAQQWDGVRYYRNHPTLSAALLASIRMLVSKRNDCEYCVGFNEAFLINVCRQTPAQVAATKADPTTAPLTDKDRAMLLFVLKAMATAHAADKPDLDRLRALGWADGDILDAVAHGARNTAADIVFNTFKIERDF